MEEKIVNRVASSPLITFDLEDYFIEGERVFFDLKPWLFQEMILKEKDFRDLAKNHDWSQYLDKLVAIGCSVDAIVPTWAYMLLTTKLEAHATHVVLGDLEELERDLFTQSIASIDPSEFKDAKVVIKGCSQKPVPVSAYVYLTERLKPYVASIMYGEPCSTVPIYKRPKKV